MINSQATSVTSLGLYQSAIVARFIFWREICHPAFQDFCNTIGQEPPKSRPPYDLSCQPPGNKTDQQYDQKIFI
jgi:hypothetical protein